SQPTTRRRCCGSIRCRGSASSARSSTRTAVPGATNDQGRDRGLLRPAVDARRAARHARLLRGGGADDVGARAEGRSVPPRPVARAVPRRGARSPSRARRDRARGGRRARIRDRAGPVDRLRQRRRLPAAAREVRAGARNRRRLDPTSLGRHREQGRRRPGCGVEQARARAAARGARHLPGRLRRHGGHAVPPLARRRPRPPDRRLLDRARGRVACDRARGARRRGRAVRRPRAVDLGQLPRQRLRVRAAVPRPASRSRPAPVRGSLRGLDRERDGAGGPVEARARHGCGLPARPCSLRAADVVRARARTLRRRGGRVARGRARRFGAAGRPRRRARARCRRRDRGGVAPVSDVCIFGATAAGVAAAAGAVEAGAGVTLVERGSHVGGMVSGGLSWTDVGDVRVLGGFARRFYAEVAAHYGVPLWSVRGPEPHVAEAILASQLAGVDVRLATDELPDAAVYVDASYEGDLLARFGVPYRVGREPRALYSESLAGRQPATRPGKHNFPVRVSPFRDDGTLLPHIRPPALDEYGWPVDAIGEGDGALQAYGFRVCLTTAGNRIPFVEPDGYDESEFELLDRLLAAAPYELPDLLGLVPDLLPNAKCDVNSIGPFSLNVLDGSNRDYPDGDDDARGRVRAHHLGYTQRFLWFLSTRFEAMRDWGLCPDEFADTGGWPHQLYIRDGRRMV